MAFEQCTKLSKLTIPSTVIKIGSAAFGNCKLLQSLHIPAGVEEGLAKALVGNSLYPHLDHVTVAEGSPYEIEGGILYKGTTVQLYMGSQEHVTVREGHDGNFHGRFQPLVRYAGSICSKHEAEKRRVARIRSQKFRKTHLTAL